MKNKTKEDDIKIFDLPSLPSLLTQPLGLEGWVTIEPVLLGALASEDPILLVGPLGSAKSFLMERLATALQLEVRFYNASLINYDDLVGIPMPDEERKGLHYISTPSSIWDTQVVFFDEINRTRPELQNKLFPMISSCSGITMIQQVMEKRIRLPHMMNYSVQSLSVLLQDGLRKQIMVPVEAAVHIFLIFLCRSLKYRAQNSL